MKLLIDIPDKYYKSIKNTAVFISGQRSGKSFINHLCNAVANGIPQETVTEFADRCRECGKMRTGHWITHEEQFNALGIAVKGGVKCSECGYTTHNRLHMEIGCPFKFCPDCGCPMVKPQESEE